MPSTGFRTVFVILLASAAIIGGHLSSVLNNSLVEFGVRNGLHVLVFAAFAVILFEFLKSSRISTAIAITATIVMVASIGGLSEFLQYRIGRQFDIFDLVRDLSGAALALVGRVLWRWSGDDRSSRVTKLASRSVSVLVSLSIIAPLVFWVSIIGLGRMASPVILDFSEWWSEYLYRPFNAEIISSGNVVGATEVLLLKRRNSGVVITPIMTDWSGYDYLRITAGMLRGPDTNIAIGLKDSESRVSWSNQIIESIVVRDVPKFRIPLGELVGEAGQPSIDLSAVQELWIMAMDRRSDTVMLIEDIRLE